MPDLGLSVQCGFVPRPDDEDEPDIVSEQAHLDVPPEGSQTAIIDLRDADIPPDRAPAELTIDNFICPA